MTNSMQTALEAIAEALHTGEEDVITVLSVIIAVILLLIAIASIVRYRNKKREKTSSETSYQKLIRKYNLTILELDLLEEMTAVMKEPRKRYQLLINAGTFRRTVHKLGDLPPEKLSLLASIQDKTGLSSGTEGTDSLSTRSFSRGMAVYLERDTGEVLCAEVYSISESDLMLKLHENMTLDVGEKLTLYRISRFGLTIYSITAVKSKESLLSAFHSEEEARQRRKIRLEIKIARSSPDGPDEELSSLMLQSTENGAVIHDPDEKLNIGDQLRVYAAHDLKDSHYAGAVVENISREKQLALIKYQISGR